MHIILYVLDALRADHLTCYGYERETSPNIDRLAAHGVVFRSCFAPATWTRPTAASILSGAYPSTHGVQTRTNTFSPKVPRLPELLAEAQFNTTAISAMANISLAGGFGKGFGDFVELFRDEGLMARRHVSTAAEEGVEQFEGDTNVVLPRSEDINKEFLRWLDRTGDRDSFAFLWSIDTHAPYEPPSPFSLFADEDYQGDVDGSRESLMKATREDAGRLIDLYDGEIRYNDYHIGQLVQALHRRGLYDDALIIMTADHGEVFSEHGLFSHGTIPYEELIHVPLIVKFPQSRFAGREVNALVELIDILPTTLDWLDLDGYEQIGSVQGRSLLPLLRGEEVELREHVYSETDSGSSLNAYLSVRGERWKYIEVRPPATSARSLTSLVKYVIEQRLVAKILRRPLWFLRRHTPRQRRMLFDLVNDESEQHNLVSKNAGEANRLRDALLAWQTRNQAIAQSIAAQPYDFEEDETIRQHLEKLGYL